MELRDKDNKEVKKTRLQEDDAEIYNKDRVTLSPEENMKLLSRKDKWYYFKEYYLHYIIIVLVMIGLSIFVISNLFIPEEPYTFFLGMFDGLQFEESLVDTIDEDFGSYLKDSSYEGEVKQDRILFESFYDTIVDRIRIDGFYDNSDFDIIITREPSFKGFSTQHMFLDLSTVLPADVLEAVSDRLVYTEATEEYPAYPCGIRITNAAYDMHVSTGEAVDNDYLGIIHNAQNIDAAIQFIRFFYGIDE